jgi:hypothetical protein
LLVLVFGVCVGESGKYERGLLPSIKACCPGVPILTRRRQRSIFEAYNDILDEASTLPDLEGVVLVHDDVEIRDPHLLNTIRQLFADTTIGLIGVVGGVGQREMSWWKADRRIGHVVHATHTDDFSRGVAEADAVDGLLMAASAAIAREVRIDGRGYPGFHGYDAELCAKVRAYGKRVVVADLEVFHNCKPGPWGKPEYGQALLEWRRRWQANGPGERSVLRIKRDLLAAASRIEHWRSR